jgi:hypothetical protein
MEYCSNHTTEDLKPEQEKNRPGLELADEIYPNRIKSVEEWMHATGYTGMFVSFTDQYVLVESPSRRGQSRDEA